MKTSKLLLTSLLAAAAMSVPAFATDYTTSQEIIALPADSINVSGDRVELTYRHDGEGKTTSLSVTIGEGATFADLTNYKYYFTLTGPLSGGGILLSKVPSESSQGDGFRSVTISGDASDFTGTWSLETVAKSGNQNGKIFGTLGSSNGSGTYVFGGVVNFETASGATVADGRYGSVLNLAQDASIAGLTGTGGLVVGGASVNGNTLTTGTAKALTIALTGNATHTFSGTIDSSISTLTISGSGTQAISGKINAGNLEVSGAKLVLSGTANIAGTTTVGAGATLDLSGGNITLASAIDNAGSVTFFSGSVVEIGALGGTIFDTAQSGRLAVSENFTIATGTGSVSGLTASGIRVNGFTYASMTVADDCKSVAVDSAIYNIASGSTATISEVTTAGTVDFINVLGTLTGLGSTFTTTPIYGTGTVSVDTGELEYHDKTFLETFEGILNISDTGEVRLGNVAGTKLTKVSKVTVSTGGTLSFWGDTFSRAVELSGGTLKSSGGNIGFSGSVTVASASKIDSGSSTITLSGAVSGTGTLTKIGAGTLELTDPTASTVSGAGGIVVEAGTLYLSGNGSGNVSGKHFCVSKDITLKNGTFLKWRDADQASQASYQYELSGALTVEGSATITNDTNNWSKEVALLGNLSGSGTLNFYRGNGDNNFNSNGRLIIAGADNSGFTGTVVIGGQTTAVSQGLDLNADLANGTISLQGGSGQPAYMRVLKSATIKGLNGNAKSSIGIGNVLAGDSVGAYTLTVGEGNFAGTIEDNGEARQYGATSSSKVMGAVLSLVKQGSGTLVLSGHNTYSGGTTIEGGVLKVDSLGYGNKGNLGTKFTQDGTVLKNGGVLEVTAAQNASTEDGYGKGGALRGFSVTSDEGTYRYSGTGTSLISHNGANDAQNQHIGIANGATLIFDVTQDAATLEVSKIIASNAAQATTSDPLAETTGALKKTGAGTLVLNPNAGTNKFTGGVTIEQGVLVAGSETALGTGKTTVESGAKLGLVAGTTVTVTNGIDLKSGAKLVVDLSSKASATETFTLDLVAGTALKYNNDVFNADCTDLITQGIVVLENMNLDGWTQSLSYADNTLKLTMTIPEPSVFGLLAGLGALVLAGTRRRRRKA